ncbi:MAG TPA: permease prefix domain 1-containing protein [Terrimesophilobacter sp.]|nr:permease prefix domain 1-containing protein [Terrimesophilobacter sp.]
MEALDSLETRIGEWRAAVLRGRAVDESDADELEGHLREQVADLETAGLSGDEAFLIAVRRLGQVDQLTAEFAREHGDRLWKQLSLSHPDDARQPSLLVMLGFAFAAAVILQVARVIADSTGGTFSWFIRDTSLFILPVLAAYFAFSKRMPWRRVVALAGVLALLAVAVNVYPFAQGASTDFLVSIHLPIALWFVVGAAYVGGELRSSARRMDFLRFSGEWAIYYTLIALGGAVLVALTLLVLTPISPEAPDAVDKWVVPSGAAGAVIVAAWLVEAKKSIIENLAPVLTAIFTPLFAVMLVVSAVAYTVSGIWRDFDRELLAGFDLLLLVVVALVVYGISARDATKRTGVMDVIRLCAVVAAVILDALVLVSMFARVGELGFTANRVAALGLNVILIVNLVGTAWLLVGQIGGRTPAVRLERWQTGYLPVFAAWVAFVVLALPPLFGFA